MHIVEQKMLKSFRQLIIIKYEYVYSYAQETHILIHILK